MQRDDMVRFSVKNCFHRQQVMYFYVKYFLGVEISVGPPNLPQIEKIQNVTKFCSKLSNYFFLKIIPKTKVYAERRYGAFFCQKLFSQTTSDVFSREIFFGCRNFCGTSKFAQIEKKQNVTKFCSKTSNYWFFENKAKNRALCRETIWCVFLSKNFFTDKK